ncbi:glycoside hydrolase family 15 protein [Aureimonas psammosilenae]|uniref:glycoside hydrolase family 15 protein n=1 Tax=Aureimonas psammosilenae TaxID=2495496 RepID=UPI001F22DDB5|nr:glycoside hydrolase family 15 protein [Aureimonas psammosilenae]
MTDSKAGFAPEQHPIANHGVIGDMRTLALVAQNGTIDFFCHPEVDSPTLFASLLDAEKGGYFHFGVEDGADMKHRQIYLPDTNILITRFLGDNGIGEIADFMPLDGSGRILRTARVIRGNVTFSVAVLPRPRYGLAKVHLNPVKGGVSIHWEEDGKAHTAYIHSDIPLRIEGDTILGQVTLGEDDPRHVAFCSGRATSSVDADYVKQSFVETRGFWHRWVASGQYPTYWRELVVRSALTLKLLTSAKHGSIAAAATFGLPEEVGGERNWDYRFCWVRDAAFTLYSLSRLGYHDETTAFVQFLMRHAIENDADRMQIMYGMDGRKELTETTLDHLSGFKGSQPVRIGNAAYTQTQMDIYGELMDALYISSKARGKPPYHVWEKIEGLMDWLAENWRQPDMGIWESRGEPREYLSSRLMCWVALDRGQRMAAMESLSGDIVRWRTERDKIQKSLLNEFWNEEVGAFTQYKGARGLDAVVLLMPLVRFINPRDPKWISTLKVVRRELVHDCLVQRYKNLDENSDGLSGQEGAFTTCSFWYVEALARSGFVSEARFMFEKLHAYANHLGLYSEELSTTGDHLGNFPQALTHLSLISAAVWLDRSLTGHHTDPDNVQYQNIEDIDDYLSRH